MMYEEVKKLPYLAVTNFGPEKKDFDEIRFKIISTIAFNVWEKAGRPHHRDMEIWLEAEQIWEFMRYMW